jgi:exopolyphosphatase/guanosine-5'-triphosphate,3'-diphosphate pyrophosphatase
MRISVLQIGATTVDLLRATVGSGGLVKWGEYQCLVRQGEDTLVFGTISQAASLSTASAVETLRAAAGARRPDQLVVVVTSAVRDASNGAAFAEMLRREHDVEPHLLSPDEEAALAYRGARSAADAAAGSEPCTVVSVGGSCLNFALGEGHRPRLTGSLPLGSHRLLSAFAPCTASAPIDLGALTALVLRSVAPTALLIDEYRPARLVFCSALARAAREHAMRASAAPGLVGGVTRAALMAAQRELAESPIEEPGEARSTRSPRADTRLVTLTVMATVMEALAVERAVVVDRGLREGVALAEYERLCTTVPERPAAMQRGR